MAATRRRYSDKDRAKAVGLAAVHGVTEAGRRTGIPKTTIQYWFDDPDFAQLRTSTREKVAEGFFVAIQVGLKAVLDGFRSDAPLRDKAQALGVVYDRHALLTGSATSRSESRDISGTLTDAELIAAIIEAESITGGSGSPPEGETEPAG